MSDCFCGVVDFVLPSKLRHLASATDRLNEMVIDLLLVMLPANPKEIYVTLLDGHGLDSDLSLDYGKTLVHVLALVLSTGLQNGIVSRCDS